MKFIPELFLQIDNEYLERVNSTKFLGIYIDSHLTWEDHIEQKYIRKLEILQKKLLGAITCSKYNTPTSPLFKQLNILKLKDLYDYKLKSLYMILSIKNCQIHFWTCITIMETVMSTEQGTSLIPIHLRQTRNLCDEVSYIRGLFYGNH